MTVHSPIYRATVYQADGATALTPAAGAPHSDSFKVATKSGVSGFQPYMEIPQGRRGQINLLTRKVDTGGLTIRILDVRTGATNADRWVSAFLGDSEGEDQFLGKALLVEESLDNGVGWADHFTGRIYAPALSGRNFVELRARDKAEDLGTYTFTQYGRQVSYAHRANLFPFGLAVDYGNLTATPPEPATLVGTGAGAYFDLPLDVERPFHSAITLQFYQALLENEEATNEHKLRVEVTITSGANSGTTGHLHVGTLTSGATHQGQRWLPLRPRRLDRLAVTPVPSADPDYLTLSTIGNGNTVTFTVFREHLPPSKDDPILVVDAHPVQFMKDILAGEFGPRDTAGAVQRAFPMETAAFTSLIADDSFGTGRWLITKTDKIQDFMEKELCLPFGLGYRLGKDGTVTPLDLRVDSISVPSTTLTNADLMSSPPGWEKSMDTAVNRIELKHYIDAEFEKVDLREGFVAYPDVPLSALVSFPLEVIWLNLESWDRDFPEKTLKIDAKGLRATLSDQDGDVARSDRNASRLKALAADIDRIHALGTATLTLPCKRNSNTNGLLPGDLVIVDVDEIPNPSANRRGGSRLTRVVARVENKIQVDLTVMDLGSSFVANTPSLGTLSLTAGAGAHSVDQVVTRNAQGDRVEVQVAVTTTAVGTRPSSTGGLWTHGGFMDANGTLTIGGLTPGRRVWSRGRSYTKPSKDGDVKIPSAWVYGSPSYVTTTSVAVPSGISVTPSGNRALVTWTNGDADLPVEVWLTQGGDDRRINLLMPGTTEHTIHRLAISTSYTVKLRHMDPAGGPGAFASQAFNTTGTPDQAPELRGVSLIVGEVG